MNAGSRTTVMATLAIVTALSSFHASAQRAQAGQWVQRGGVWVLEAVVQDQVLNRAVYPAARYVDRQMAEANAYAAQHPTVTYQGNYANSTPAYQYRSQQPMTYGQQVQPQYYQHQQPSYQAPRRICSNGRQQWSC
jgi:hypothetical protein